MKATALVLVVCCFAVAVGQFSPFGFFSNGRNRFGLRPRPRQPPGCRRPLDTFSSTKFSPDKNFYRVGEKIEYQCLFSNTAFPPFVRSKTRECVAAFPGSAFGFWTSSAPYCARKF